LRGEIDEALNIIPGHGRSGTHVVHAAQQVSSLTSSGVIGTDVHTVTSDGGVGDGIQVVHLEGGIRNYLVHHLVSKGAELGSGCIGGGGGNHVQERETGGSHGAGALSNTASTDGQEGAGGGETDQLGRGDTQGVARVVRTQKQNFGIGTLQTTGHGGGGETSQATGGDILSQGQRSAIHISRASGAGLHHQGGAIVTHAVVGTTVGRGDGDVEALEASFISSEVIDFDEANQLESFNAGPTIHTFSVVGGQAVDLITGLKNSTGFFFVSSHC